MAEKKTPKGRNPTLGEDIAAAVVLRDGATASVLDLRQFAATRLAAFKIPRRFVFLDGIPRTATGRPQRVLLARQFQNRSEPRHATDRGNASDGA